MANLILNGYLQASGDGCGCGASGSGPQVRLGFPCGGSSYYQSVIEVPAIRVNTLGIVGAEFVDLEVLEQFSAIEFLYMTADQTVALRIGAREATMLGASPIGFPLNLSGGETFIYEIDGVSVTYTAPAGSIASMTALVNVLNSTAAAAGLPTPRFVAEGSALRINGVEPSTEGNITIGSGTLNGTLGFATAQSADGAGEDVTFSGVFMVAFQRYPYAPERIMISGQANISIMAAGKTSP